MRVLLILISMLNKFGNFASFYCCFIIVNEKKLNTLNKLKINIKKLLSKVTWFYKISSIWLICGKKSSSARNTCQGFTHRKYSFLLLYSFKAANHWSIWLKDVITLRSIYDIKYVVQYKCNVYNEIILYNIHGFCIPDINKRLYHILYFTTLYYSTLILCTGLNLTVWKKMDDLKAIVQFTGHNNVRWFWTAFSYFR